jgi:hypothetical protein
MGLAFTGMTAGQRSLLESWLAELVTKLSPTSYTPPARSSTHAGFRILGRACGEHALPMRGGYYS